MSDGDAVVYCSGAFSTTYGKTAHGLVRFTRRYRVRAVIDPECAGKDAGELLDGTRCGIPIVATLDEALAVARRAGGKLRYFVVGLATDGGRVSSELRLAARRAIEAGLSVDNGLHEFFSDDPQLVRLADQHAVTLRDVRKTAPRHQLHAFSGRIERVEALRVAVLGTDSAIGKRTTAWILLHALHAAGYHAELIGTGQTAWMQGARFGIILDSLINDFVAGELEHAVVSAWDEKKPQVMVIEGQGSLMNPAYPGGFEIVAATRPQAVILQHAPARLEYDGFPGYPIQPLDHQIRAIELVSGRPVVAVTVNHEGLDSLQTDQACRRISDQTGLSACDPIRHGAAALVSVLCGMVPQ